MKKHLLLFLLCLAVIQVVAQPKPFRDASGKYGIRGLNGEIAQKPIYESVNDFVLRKNQWYSIAYLQGKAALINMDCKPITPFKYSFIWPFSGEDCYTLVNIGGSLDDQKMISGGKYGLINIFGQEICDGVLYDDITQNYDKNGKLTSCFLRIGNKQGIVNLTLLCPTPSPICYDELWDYFSDLCVVKTGDKWGCLSLLGTVLLNCSYDFINILATPGNTFLHTRYGGQTLVYEYFDDTDELSRSTEDEMFDTAAGAEYEMLFN